MIFRVSTCMDERDQYNDFYNILYTYRCTESSKTRCRLAGKEQWRSFELGYVSTNEISEMTLIIDYIHIEVLRVV